MMMSLILPLDMVEEILSRVPATSLKRLRSTCTQWNQRFTKKHFSKAPKESMVLMLKEYRVFSVSLNLKIAPPSLEFKGDLGLKDSHSTLEEDDIHLVVHYEGLLLCITEDSRPVVWNPCLGETRWIQPKTSYEWSSTFALGYEKTKSGHSYKMLMFWKRDNDLPYQLNGSEIYDFNSDSWRVVDNIVALDCFLLSFIGVSLKGNRYWLAYDTNGNQFSLCFDFTAERFKPMCLPLVVGQMALSVVGDKQLSVVSQSDSTLTMWVTNKTDTDIKGVLEWSKSFTVDIPTRGAWFPYLFSFSVVEEKKVTLCSDGILVTGRNMVYIIREDEESYTEITYIEPTNIF
ncbi:PREDICTED: putative F-box/kelch-repeat protein At3g22730 [Camelina sativa]|uniref:F-box/kelch-repeat protein At3g22730 n=1 Tax=Camelina sativa TaxID=90675 RepID=A0ABM0SZB0_CAMSA|nr:PREDICTED: putative F-box/kelch-repeat protein At3g22730 [Camelina sativa]